MTMYMHADIEHISRGEWRTYVPSRQLFFHGESEDKAKQATVEGIKQATGDRDVKIIWRQH